MRNLIYAALAIFAVWAFDSAMSADRERLCSNDLTAFKECNK